MDWSSAILKMWDFQLTLLVGPSWWHDRSSRRNNLKHLYVDIMLVATILPACVYMIAMIYEATSNTLSLLDAASLVSLCLVSTYPLLRQRRLIDSQVRALVSFSQRQLYLRSFGYKLSFAFISTLFITIIRSLLLAISIVSKPPSSMATWMLSVSRAVGNRYGSWILLTGSLYWTIVTIHNLVVLERIKGLRCTSFNSQTIILIITQIIRNREQINSQLSLLPLTWFLYGIMSIARAATSMNSIYGLGATPVFFSNYIVPLIVVLCVSRQQRELNEQLDMIEANVVDFKFDGVKQHVIIRLVKRLKATRMTGLRFFELGEPFLVSYLGSMMTFGVLIAGLAR